MKSPKNYFDVAGFIKLFIYKAQAVCCSSLGISIASRISRLVRWFFLIFWTQRSTVYRRIYTAGKIGPDRRQKIGPEWPDHFCKETVSFSRGQRRLYPQKTGLSGPFFWRVRTNLVFCIDRIHLWKKPWYCAVWELTCYNMRKRQPTCFASVTRPVQWIDYQFNMAIENAALIDQPRYLFWKYDEVYKKSANNNKKVNTEKRELRLIISNWLLSKIKDFWLTDKSCRIFKSEQLVPII